MCSLRIVARAQAASSRDVGCFLGYFKSVMKTEFIPTTDSQNLVMGQNY